MARLEVSLGSRVTFPGFPHGGGFEFKIIKDVVFISIEVTGLGASDAGG